MKGDQDNMKPIEKSYLSFAEGFLGPKFIGRSRHLDWEKAKKIIEEKKEKIKSVNAGLAEDWGCTYGEVWNSECGIIPEDQTDAYTSSVWATPAIEIEYVNGEIETVECWEYTE